MTKPTMNTVIPAISAVILFLFASMLRLPYPSDSFILWGIKGILVYLIYVGMLAAWAVSLSRRIIQKNIRNYLLAIAGCMMFWIVVRSVKFKIFTFYPVINRMLWYTFYIPMILIPLLSFFVAVCLGNDEKQYPEGRHRLLFIPALFLILLIMTNDLHQWAFVLSSDFTNNSKAYTNNILYFIAVGWIVLFEILFLIIIGKKRHVVGTTGWIWAPYLILGIGIAYTFLYIHHKDHILVHLIEMTPFLCFLVACIWESCIKIGMIPSNTRYDVLFCHSAISAQIVDESGHVRYGTAKVMPLDEESFDTLIRKGRLQQDGNTEIHAAPIAGGYVIWQEDIALITRLNQRLSDNRQRLNEQKYMMEQELINRTETLRIQEQTRIYELISKRIQPQLIQIEKRLDDIEDKDDAFRYNLLCEINVLAAYIKRRGNLILLAEETRRVSIKELEYCLVESLENLKPCGVFGSISLGDSIDLSIDFAALCYDLFEEVVEQNLSYLIGISVKMLQSEEELVFMVQSKTSQTVAPFLWDIWEGERISPMGCRISHDLEDGVSLTVSLSFLKGGEGR
ncbi:MAG: hypothetical protein ACOX4U_02980 [Anaerovoracaceae bacterium]